MIAVEPVFATTEHVLIALGGLFTGATGVGILAHAVQTFPVPKNPYGAWLLGVIQFAVGQKERAVNTLNGYSTVTIPGEQMVKEN